nr:biotin carboxylase [Actinomycetota bacterium]
PVHAEVRVAAGGARVIEVAARSIGGLCSRALRFGAGISLEEVILRHALGLGLDDLHREDRAAGVMMLPIPRSGRLVEVGGLDAARAVPGVEGVEVTVARGREVRALPEGDRYLGFLFARGPTSAEVEGALRRAFAHLAIDIT